ncbi:unnamed protein product [Prorocentrum cordatum]|uniref:Spondin-like TSP1 domain-containing protein n=1 Tax=Prorocentrum cordatum TaxID=2364126 RepID=A0ABN9XX82_9DINO|nr:unnamed protein product [Polarella glacialis]
MDKTEIGRALDLGCQNGDVAQWLYLLNVTHSNLGGAGPDTTPPETLRFESALGGEGRGGDCVALEVSTARGAEYEPESAQLNGAGRGASALRSDAKPGQVSVRAGTRASLVFRFFRCGSSSPAALPRFNLTFYSPYGPTEQKVTASAYAQSSLRDSRVFAKSYSDEGTTFRSQGKCTGRADSEECSFTLHYTGTHEFPVILEAGDSPGGGELVEPLRFSGAACGPAPRGGSEASACSPAVCGTGFELLPEQLLPAACEQEACSEEECCRVAEDPVRGDEPPGGADESAAVAVAVASTQCSGREQTWRECPGLPVCEVCRPTNCEFEDWGDWSAVGGCSGLCKRSRGHTKNNECGKPCSGPSTETVARHDDPLCFPEKCSNTSQDCRWSEWSEWSACAKECSTCRLKQAQRSRRIDTPRRAGGRDCEGVWNQTKPCQASSDEDCKLSSWGEWTQCSKSCGTGWHSRMRRVVQEARYGGKACSGPKDRGGLRGEPQDASRADGERDLEAGLPWGWSCWAPGRLEASASPRSHRWPSAGGGLPVRATPPRHTGLPQAVPVRRGSHFASEVLGPHEVQDLGRSPCVVDAAPGGGPAPGVREAASLEPQLLEVNLPRSAEPGAMTVAEGPHGAVEVQLPADHRPGERARLRLAAPPEMRVQVPEGGKPGDALQIVRVDRVRTDLSLRAPGREGRGLLRAVRPGVSGRRPRGSAAGRRGGLPRARAGGRAPVAAGAVPEGGCCTAGISPRRCQSDIRLGGRWLDSDSCPAQSWRPLQPEIHRRPRCSKGSPCFRVFLLVVHAGDLSPLLASRFLKSAVVLMVYPIVSATSLFLSLNVSLPVHMARLLSHCLSLLDFQLNDLNTLQKWSHVLLFWVSCRHLSNSELPSSSAEPQMR